MAPPRDGAQESDQEGDDTLLDLAGLEQLLTHAVGVEAAVELGFERSPSFHQGGEGQVPPHLGSKVLHHVVQADVDQQFGLVEVVLDCFAQGALPLVCGVHADDVLHRGEHRILAKDIVDEAREGRQQAAIHQLMERDVGETLGLGQDLVLLLKAQELARGSHGEAAPHGTALDLDLTSEAGDGGAIGRGVTPEGGAEGTSRCTSLRMRSRSGLVRVLGRGRSGGTWGRGVT